MYGEGISKIGEILDLGVKAGIVEKSGAWFSYDSVRIGQGRENAKNFLKEHPELADKLESAIRGKTDRSDERSDGHERVSTCRSRWTRSRSTNNTPHAPTPAAQVLLTHYTYQHT